MSYFVMIVPSSREGDKGFISVPCWLLATICFRSISCSLHTHLSEKLEVIRKVPNLTLWPEASKKAPMDAARPTQMVLTSGPMCLIVSKTAMPARHIACLYSFLKLAQIVSATQAHVGLEEPGPFLISAGCQLSHWNS